MKRVYEEDEFMRAAREDEYVDEHMNNMTSYEESLEEALELKERTLNALICYANKSRAYMKGR